MWAVFRISFTTMAVIVVCCFLSGLLVGALIAGH